MQHFAKTRTALVVGARGRLGRVVADEFSRRGWQVRALVRNRTATSDTVLPAGVEIFEGDARSPLDLIAAAEGADVIVNAANPPYSAWNPAVLEIADAVIAAACASGAVHLFPGNVYNYGWPVPELLTEMTAQRPSARKGYIRVEAERRFREAADIHGMRTIVLRAGDFYGGTGRGSWFDQVIAEHADRGRMTYPGPLNVPHAWAYLPDLATTFEALARRRGEFGPFDTFHFPGHTVTGEEMADAFAMALGRRIRTDRMPWWLVRLGAPFVKNWREISEMAYLWHVPHRLDGAKLEMAIGDIPTTPFDRAVSESLEALGFETRPMQPSASTLVPV